MKNGFRNKFHLVSPIPPSLIPSNLHSIAMNNHTEYFVYESELFAENKNVHIFLTLHCLLV